MVVGVVTILFNLLVLLYYKPRAKQPTTHFLFFLLALSDVMSGVSALLHCGVLIIYYQDSSRDQHPTDTPLTATPSAPTTSLRSTETRESVLDWRAVFCLVTYFVTQFSKHLSVFMNLILSFIRTYLVLSPSHTVKRLVVTLTVGVFSLLTALFLCVVLAYFVQILLLDPSADSIYLIFSMCFNKIFEAYVAVLEHLNTQVDDSVINTILIIVPYVLPSALCLLCCCVFVWSLYTKPALSCRVEKRNRHIVGTVLTLTLLFIVSCSALIVVWVYYDLYPGGPSSLRTAAYVQYTFYNLLPILNSALNPVVLILRGKPLRNYVMSAWTRSHSAHSHSTRTKGPDNMAS